MKKDIKERWVTALRSGKYEQGQGALQNDQGKFCCLGVLCDLAAQEGAVDALQTLSGRDVGYDGRTGILPLAVDRWAGMTISDPLVRVGGEWVTLTTLNDERELTFEQIADLIEAQPEDWMGDRS